MEFIYVYISFYKVSLALNSQKYNDIDDNELLQNFYHDRDNKWLGILLPRYTMLLLGVCMKYLKNEEDAKDCVQQIFLKIINELHKYKVEYFKSWMYMIAKNHCLMRLRDKGKMTAELNENMARLPEEAEDKIAKIDQDMLIGKMLECIKLLSPDQQQCVRLFYFEKKSYAAIAAITGFTPLQVKSYIQNGKRNLRLLMKE
jgi:RNA polymerase sigma factor (sigma-70 family)